MFSRAKVGEARPMSKSTNEESEHMMLLLQELAALRKADTTGLSATKSRKEITQEMKRLATQKKQCSGEGDSSPDGSPNL
jgi:hypothetical protein